jgi:hypothetical protein
MTPAQLLAEQPAPVESAGSVEVYPEVYAIARAHLANVAPETIEVLRQRRQQGIERYGRELHTDNGRNAWADLAQELVDAAMYAAQIVLEGEDDGSDGPAYDIAEALIDLLDEVVKREVVR